LPHSIVGQLLDSYWTVIGAFPTSSPIQMPTFLKRTGKWQASYVGYVGANKKRHRRYTFATEAAAEMWAALGRAEHAPAKTVAKTAANKRKRAKTTDAQRRATGLEKYGDNSKTEARAIEKVSQILEKLELKLVRDGAKNDIGLRSKVDNLSDSWWGIQVKSCTERCCHGKNKKPKATFSGVNTYPDSIVMCVLLTPLIIWLRHGSDLVENGPTLHESQKTKFTNALCYQENEEGGILQNDLEARLNEMFHDKAYAYEPQPMNTFDLQLGTLQFIEDWAHRLYLRSKNRPEASIRRAIGEVENGHHDDVEDEFKIQEKVCRLHRNAFLIHLSKRAGTNEKGIGIAGPYEEEDFHVLRAFVFYTKDKDGTIRLKRESHTIGYSPGNTDYATAIDDIRSWQLLGYFEISMKKLVAEGLIKTATTKGQVSFNALLPEDVRKEIKHPPPKRITKEGKRKTHVWTRDCFHRCAPFPVSNVNRELVH